MDRKGFICISHLQVTAHHFGIPEQQLKAGIWRQELMQRPWRNAAYWFVPYGFLNLLSYTPQGHLPNAGIAPSELGPPTSVINQDSPGRLAYKKSDGSDHSLKVPSSQMTLA